MKDKEIYDFFKDRKGAFDEAPGDALWAKIENEMAGPSASVNVAGRSLLKKLFAIGLLGVAIAVIWIVAFSDKTVEENAVPQNTITAPKTIEKESTGIKAIESTDVSDAYTLTDSVKKKKAPIDKPDAVLNPLPGTPQAATSGEIAKADTPPFDPDAVKAETKTAPGRIIITVKQALTKEQFGLYTEKIMKDNSNAAGTIVIIKAPGHKPFRQAVAPQLKANDAKLQTRDTLGIKPEIVYLGTQRGKKDTLKVEYISGPQQKNLKLTKDSLVKKQEPVRFVNEVVLPKTDSLKTPSKNVKAETKKAKGSVTITVKENLTKEQFERYTQKVIDESTYAEGTIIIIIAPGHEQFRHEVTETAEFGE